MNDREANSPRVLLKQATGAFGTGSVGAASPSLSVRAALTANPIGAPTSRASLPVEGVPIEQSTAGDDIASEFVVRHIPLIPLLALLIILGNFMIFFTLFT